jgi:hypothetical protein
MRLAIFAAAALVAGCAASSHELGSQALARQDWAAAEQHLVRAVRNGDRGAWNDLGVAYHRQGRITMAIEAFKMGARYGDPTARANLERNNIPVPPADLAARPAGGDYSGAAAFLEGFNRGRSGGDSINCTTIGIGRGDSMTSCRR